MAGIDFDKLPPELQQKIHGMAAKQGKPLPGLESRQHPVNEASIADIRKQAAPAPSAPAVAKPKASSGFGPKAYTPGTQRQRPAGKTSTPRPVILGQSTQAPAGVASASAPVRTPTRSKISGKGSIPQVNQNLSQWSAPTPSADAQSVTRATGGRAVRGPSSKLSGKGSIPSVNKSLSSFGASPPPEKNPLPNPVLHPSQFLKHEDAGKAIHKATRTYGALQRLHGPGGFAHVLDFAYGNHLKGGH